MSPNEIFDIITTHDRFDNHYFNLQTLGDMTFSQDKIVFIIRGLPGSGKTMLADEIGRKFSRHVMYDVFDVNKFYVNTQGKFVFDIRNSELYSSAILGQFVARINSFKDDITSHVVIYDNVLPTLRGLAKVVQASLECKYITKIVTIKGIYKDEFGNYANPHRVPAETINSMARHFYIPSNSPNFSFEEMIQRINRPLKVVDPHDACDPSKNGHIISSVLLPQDSDIKDLIEGNYKGGNKQKAYVVYYDDGYMCLELESDLIRDGVKITPQ